MVAPRTPTRREFPASLPLKGATEQVIIRGSRVISTKWELSVDPHRPPRTADEVDQNVMLGFPAYIFSKQLWMTTLPDSMFEDGYFPFRMPNVTDAEFNIMTWALKWKGRFPYSLPRGMLFQDGRRMVQLAAYEDLVRLEAALFQAHQGPGGQLSARPALHGRCNSVRGIRAGSGGASI
jgi:hypothetical protein